MTSRPFDDEPQRLFEGDFEHSILATHPDYDVSPDGQHFYMIRGERVEAESRLRVVVGWLDSVAGATSTPSPHRELLQRRRGF